MSWTSSHRPAVASCQAQACSREGSARQPVPPKLVHPHSTRPAQPPNCAPQLDKIVSGGRGERSWRSGDPSSEGVQRDLLPIIEVGEGRVGCVGVGGGNTQPACPRGSATCREGVRTCTRARTWTQTQASTLRPPHLPAPRPACRAPWCPPSTATCPPTTSCSSARAPSTP